MNINPVLEKIGISIATVGLCMSATSSHALAGEINRTTTGPYGNQIQRNWNRGNGEVNRTTTGPYGNQTQTNWTYDR